MSLLTFKKGIHPKYNKEYSHDRPIECPDLPKEVTIPLLQHLGAPCKPLVEKGDTVKTGQKIGETNAFVTSPIHSSISGTVKAVEPRLHPGGTLVPSIVIESDGQDEHDPSCGKKQNINSLSPDQIKEIIQNAGVVGLGGACFPTHIKLSPPKDKTIDTILINGAECEPYLTADHRMMLEHPKSMVDGLKALMKAALVKNAYIGIEANKRDAIKAVTRVLKNDPDTNGNIAVAPLEVKYPQGAEKMLIHAILKREVPAGGLPMDVGVVVQNVGTAIAVANAIECSRPLIDRIVTITGSGVINPKNLLLRIGTSFRDAIEFCGGLHEDAKKVINGGPMMGITQSSMDVPVIKGTSGILVLTEKELDLGKPRPCIGCGNCIDACPMRLLPTAISAYGEHNKLESAEKYGILNCIECGCCSFVCPSKRLLVQWIRLGKGKIMAEKRGAKK